jgi:hypothetical protein
MSRSTLQVAVAEVDGGAEVSERVRQAGAGRKRLTETDPGLIAALDALVEPTARGDPMSPLRWTAKSLQTLADQLSSEGHPVSSSKVGQLLNAMGYSLQAPAKEVEGTGHPDRDAQSATSTAKPAGTSTPASPSSASTQKRRRSLGTLPTRAASTGPRAPPSG